LINSAEFELGRLSGLFHGYKNVREIIDSHKNPTEDLLTIKHLMDRLLLDLNEEIPKVERQLKALD